jgi:hypothetical protein
MTVREVVIMTVREVVTVILMEIVDASSMLRNLSLLDPAAIITQDYQLNQKVNAPDPDENENEFVDKIHKFLELVHIGRYPCFLDSDRRQFLNFVLPLLYQLDRNLVSGNGHHRLVIGPKGTGKSSLPCSSSFTSNRLVSLSGLK